MRGWMSQDGERPAVPAPTCSAGLAQDGGTRPAPPTKSNSLGEGRRRQERAPRPGPPKVCLDHGAWMHGDGHSSAGAPRQLPPPGRAWPSHPAAHPWKDGEGDPTGLGKGPGPASSPPQRENAGWLASPSGRGWRGCRLCLPPQSLGQQEMGMPAGTRSPAPAGESWRS